MATVMVLADSVYVDTSGLPASGSGSSYVLWRVGSNGKPVGMAAFDGRPSAGPVRVASMNTPVSDVDAFTLSKEPGQTVPAAPTDVVAQGKVD